MQNPRYVVITPAQNEEDFLPFTIRSLVAQTVAPRQWIIVDDGSTDNTPAIARVAAERYEWIELVERGERGYRTPGRGVIDAFYRGYNRVERDWDFLVKLDGDLSFDPDYFEKCFLRFQNDPNLWIGGGTISILKGDTFLPEAPKDPAFHVRGATKIYRRECWEAIAGLIRAPGWDTVDEYKANMLGGHTYTFPELHLRHHRLTGEAQGIWKNWMKNGLANYVAGYHPLFMILKCFKRAFAKPYGIGALALLIGYVSGFVRRAQQVDDSFLLHYVRSQQLRKITFRESLWDRRSL